LILDEALVDTGEWWSRNVVDIESDAVSSGQLPRESDAFTVNGVTGELYQCASTYVIW
jgi:laccase